MACDGTTATDTACSPCGTDEYSDGTGACSPHVVDCDALGKVVQTSASSTADAVCGDLKQCECEFGTAATGTDCPSDGATKCSVCPAGFGLALGLCTNIQHPQHTATHYSTPHHAIPCRTTPHHAAPRYAAVRHGTPRHIKLRHTTPDHTTPFHASCR